MIESKLKAKNCNRGQPFRPCWVSSARCIKLYEVFSWSTEINILTKCRWWWPQMKLKSKIFANWPVSVHHYVYCPLFFWGRTVGLSDPACCSFLTWFGYDFPAGQFVSVRSFLIAATKWYSGFFLLSLLTRFACDTGQLAKIWIWLYRVVAPLSFLGSISLA